MGSLSDAGIDEARGQRLGLGLNCGLVTAEAGIITTIVGNYDDLAALSGNAGAFSLWPNQIQPKIREVRAVASAHFVK